jgi:four helix bundle protein
MEPFENLEVWKKMHRLVLDVYGLTSVFPDSEKYGLVSQMRRAAVSVAANMAEGSKRRTPLDRNRFHVIADASLMELKYYFILSADLEYASRERLDALAASAGEVGRMLAGLMKSVSDNCRRREVDRQPLTPAR